MEVMNDIKNVKEIVVVDIETTGLYVDVNKIVEIGLVKLNLETGERTQLMNYVCHEDGITKLEIENSWIFNNTDLNVEQIQYSINLKRLIPTIQRIFDKYPATAFNSKFDFGFLENRGLNIPNKYHDPMLILEKVMKLPQKNKKYSGYKYPSVQEAYDYLFPDNDYTELHRGGDDAFHEAQIIYEINKRNLIQE